MPADVAKLLAEVLEGVTLSTGACGVFAQLHAVGVRVAQARGYATLPDTVVYHLPATLLAPAVGYTRRHLYRLLAELVASGVLAYGGQAQKVNDMGLHSGCLWAVKLKAGDVTPHIRREEWKHQYRDFAGDIEAGRTAKALLEAMSHLQDQEKEEGLREALQVWAVTPGRIKSPVGDVGVTCELGSLRDVVYALGELPVVHPQARASRVGELGEALSVHLKDDHSRRWYCSLIWQAWRGYVEGRADLQVLAAALMRLEGDLREGAPWQTPGAVLAARLRA
ncbi:hypothetical protein ACFSR9_15340 [Deinococcus taklimakanensis]|uniref:Uncharacterized protein n=1 Tax=Deinococcus taklimakanensis TaxID=536443 RepID=A0ABW5P6L9_9DEIO